MFINYFLFLGLLFVDFCQYLSQLILYTLFCLCLSFNPFWLGALKQCPCTCSTFKSFLVISANVPCTYYVRPLNNLKRYVHVPRYAHVPLGTLYIKIYLMHKFIKLRGCLEAASECTSYLCMYMGPISPPPKNLVVSQKIYFNFIYYCSKHVI